MEKKKRFINRDWWDGDIKSLKLNLREIDYFLFNVLLKNISLLWGCHYYQ